MSISPERGQPPYTSLVGNSHMAKLKTTKYVYQSSDEMVRFSSHRNGIKPSSEFTSIIEWVKINHQVTLLL